MDKNLKPFDLTRALAGNPVVTRDGRQVTNLIVFESTEGTLVGLLKLDGGTTVVYQWKKDGRYYSNSTLSGADLFMAPVEKTAFVNIYPAGVFSYIDSAKLGAAYATEAAANSVAAGSRIGGKALKITYFE